MRTLQTGKPAIAQEGMPWLHRTEAYDDDAARIL